MADYSTYLKAELIDFLNQRDATIKTLEAQIVTLNDTIAAKEGTIGKQLVTITTLENTKNQQEATINLQNQRILRDEVAMASLREDIINLGNIIDGYERGTVSTATQIINMIHLLPIPEREKLVSLIRTEPKAIDASVIFNYGKSKPLEKETENGEKVVSDNSPTDKK